MRTALVVGGSSGIGLAVANVLSKDSSVTIIDKNEPSIELPSNVKYQRFDLRTADYSIFDKFENIDTLVITAGFGKLELFENYSDELIVDMMTVNAVAVIRVIKHFYDKLLSFASFDCAVMGSIAGFMSSPFYAVYGASKASLKIFIESVNVELIKSNTHNQILNVSPGSLSGTSFNGSKTDLSQIIPFAEELVDRMRKKEDLWIPNYEDIYHKVLNRYAEDFRAEGIHSYEYKLQRYKSNDTQKRYS